MALILILSFFVVLAFVVGVSLLFRGYRNLPDGKTAPMGELEKVQTDLKTANAETEKLRMQANTLAVQLDEMKGKVTWAQGNVQSLEETLRKSSQAYVRLEQVEKDLNFLSQKADSQAREAIDVITRLAAQAEALKLQSASAPASAEAVNPADETAIKDENQKLQIQIEGYASKVKDLEAAVTAAQEAGAKYETVAKTSAQFTEENNVLKKNLADLEEKIKIAQSEAEQLKNEQSQKVLDLEAKIAQLETERQSIVPPPIPEEKVAEPVVVPESVAPVQAAGIDLEKELQRVRLQSEERIVQANAALVKMNSDMEELNAQINDKDHRLKKLTEDYYATREELAVSLRTVQELKELPKPAVVTVADDLEKQELQQRLEQLGAINQRLLDKEQILTAKLVQSRAQALSLERLCDELKQQHEQAGAVLK